MKNQYFLGLDIGGTNIKAGVFEKSGKLAAKWSIRTDTTENGRNILNDIKKSVDERIGNDTEIIGVGAGIPGPVDKSGVVHFCVNLGWNDKNIKNELETLFGVRCAAENDANCAALGEYWMGAGKGAESLVLATIGTGIGGGIILDGKILNGYNASAGEIGHIVINTKETEYCTCGKKGCAEQYASAAAMEKTYERLYGTKISAKEIVERAKNNEPQAEFVFEKGCKALGQVLSSVAGVINPEIFIIGGGLANGGDFVLDTIRGYYRQFAFHTMKETEFKIAQLKNDAGIYGAVKLLID